MEGMHTSPIGKTLAFAALAVALTTTGCQGFNTFVTGEKFLLAPKGSPRVEAELDVDVQSSFFAALQDVDDAKALDEAISNAVLSVADVGMRFYAIRSEEYDRGDARPAYRMVVEIQDLLVNLDQKMIEQEGSEPWIESSVKSLDCTVAASVQKRRADAPPLVVGRRQGTGHVRIKGDPESSGAQVTYRVRRESDDLQRLYVSKQDVLAVVEKAVVDALRDVVKSVDRDFELNGVGDS